MRLPARIALFSVGVVLGGSAVGFLLQAHLGVSSYDVLNSGIARTIGVPVGTASWILSAIVIVIAVLAFIGKKRPAPQVGLWATIGLLTLANVAIAVLW